jgi:hypothetical protein
LVISSFEVPGLCPFIKKGQLMWVLCCNFSFLWTNALSNLHNILNHITQGKFYFSYYAFTVPKLCPHAESRSKLHHHMISFFNFFFAWITSPVAICHLNRICRFFAIMYFLLLLSINFSCWHHQKTQQTKCQAAVCKLRRYFSFSSITDETFTRLEYMSNTTGVL